ncbi:MAG TPA: MBL fold metallo-hydrolase [Xanthomonadaceae bacterium]|nr:MBL fold metallo-hydrolase [Xanthomonadaceae bacterium]
MTSAGVPSVRGFHHADTGTWSYLAWDPDTRAAAIVDPVLDYQAASGRISTVSAQALVDAATTLDLDVQWLLETHAHADHLSAAHWLKSNRYTAAKTAIGAGIVQVQETFARLFNLGPDFRADGSQFDHLFHDGERFTVGGIQANVMAVSGHTSDSCAYLIGDALFTGDSLFMPDAGTARCDFPGGDAGALYRSIRRMYALPADTRVFVCHDYGKRTDNGSGRGPACETSIGAQKHGNIHVREGTGEAEFIALREARDATLPMPALILPAVQTNIRAGALPDADDNGVRYLRIPLDQF